MEKTSQLNGFKPRSYGDVVAIAALTSMFLSVVMWGLKLEAKLEVVQKEVGVLQAQVGNGILPRSEERLSQVQRRLVELGDDFDEHDAEHRASER